MQVYVERQARWKGIRWTCRDRWCCEGPPTLSAPLHRVHQAERAGSGVRDAAGRGRAAAGGCQSISRRSPGPVLPSSRPFQVNHSVLYGESHVTIRQALSRAVHSGAPVTLVVARRTQHVNVFQPTSEKSLPASYPLLASGHEKIVKVSPVCRHSAIHWDVYGFQAKSEVNLPDIVNNTDALLHQVSRRLRARSLEPLTGLAIWNCVPLVVCLQKDERGLGFSIVDYQVSCALCFVVLIASHCSLEQIRSLSNSSFSPPVGILWRLDFVPSSSSPFEFSLFYFDLTFFVSAGDYHLLCHFLTFTCRFAYHSFLFLYGLLLSVNLTLSL